MSTKGTLSTQPLSFKVGDLVRKRKGNDCGLIGVVVKVVVNKMPRVDEDERFKRSVTIVTVNYAGKIKNWYADYLEVVNYG